MRRAPLAVLLALVSATCFGQDEPTAPIEDSVPDAARAVLENADSLEVFAIDPAPQEGAARTLRGYPIARSASVAKEQRRPLVDKLYEGIVANSRHISAYCFEPHHALRATKGAETVELVICFTCYQIQVHGPGETEVKALTFGHAEDDLDALLGGALREKPAAPTIEKTLFEGKTVEAWAEQLRRSGARRYSGKLDDPSRAAVPALARIMRDGGDGPRRIAMRALARVGKNALDAAPILSEMLAGNDGSRCSAAQVVVEALGPDGAFAVAPLERIVASLRSYEAASAAETLGHVGSAARSAGPAVANLLLARKQQRKLDEVVTCVTALARIEATDPASIAALGSCASHAEAWVRRPAVQALGRLGVADAPGRAAIAAACDSTDSSLRLAATVARARLDRTPERALAAIDAVLSSKGGSPPDWTNRWLRRQAAQELADERPARVPRLMLLLDDRDDWIRQVGAIALGSLGPAGRDALPALEKCASGAREPLRSVVADALDRLRAE